MSWITAAGYRDQQNLNCALTFIGDEIRTHASSTKVQHDVSRPKRSTKASFKGVCRSLMSRLRDLSTFQLVDCRVDRKKNNQ